MTLAAFGVTGDLMRLKILPALYELHAKGELPAPMRILGISRRPWDDARLRDYIREVVPEAQEPFLSLFTFLQGDVEDPATFAALARESEGDDVLAYLSLAPSLYHTAFANMQQAGFDKRSGATRVMIEKPFGTGGAEAERLYAELEGITATQNIFLVDHYLAKDWVRELGALPVPREQIAQVRMRFWEDSGVERRGPLYDQLGALRDVVQNHLLQMLAHLVAPDDRALFLEEMQLLSPSEIATKTLRAQYEGYRSIPGVAPQSRIETYCRVGTTLDAPGWTGVEVKLEAGKRLPRARKEAELTLKDGSVVTIPERPNKVGEYETLLRAAMQGNQSLFPSLREVRAQWRFIDPILAAWAKGVPALTTYPPGAVPSGAEAV